MPSFMITMARIDRRTAIVEADDVATAKDMARAEFEFAEVDDLCEHGSIEVVDVQDLDEEE
jgi:hypothetical protein